MLVADDTIRRLQAFEKAGADVLFAPGLPDLAAVRAVCAAVSKPVNFMAGSCQQFRAAAAGRKIDVAAGVGRPTLRLGQVPCMARRVNPARTGR